MRSCRRGYSSTSLSCRSAVTFLWVAALAHHRAGTRAGFVHRALRQRLDLDQRHREELLHDREHRAHPHPDERLVAREEAAVRDALLLSARHGWCRRLGAAEGTVRRNRRTMRP
jgi:hypothetical protein